MAATACSPIPQAATCTTRPASWPARRGSSRRTSPSAVSGETYDFFPMPPIEFNGITTSADLFGMFNDTPQAASLMRYLVTVEAQSIWPSRGGAVSGNSAVPLDVYPDETSMRLAEALNDAETVRYDASDKMPAEMEAAVPDRDPDYVQNPGNLDSILDTSGVDARDGLCGDHRGRSAGRLRATATTRAWAARSTSWPSGRMPSRSPSRRSSPRGSSAPA